MRINRFTRVEGIVVGARWKKMIAISKAVLIAEGVWSVLSKQC
jgi:hypothetical protein